MGINSISYLVLPKIIASAIVYPLLVIFSMVCGMIGGYLVGMFTGIVAPAEFIQGLRSDFNPFTISFALIKAFAFGLLVSSISCFKGYYTQGGALEVGVSSTQAVKTSVIAILI